MSGNFILTKGSKSECFNSKDYSLTYVIALKLKIQELSNDIIRVSLILYNCGGILSHNNKRVGTLENARYLIPDTSNFMDRWSTEYFMEVEGKVCWIGYNRNWRWYAEMGRYIYRIVSKATNKSDPYYKMKKKSTERS